MTILFSLRPHTPNIGNDVIGLAADAILRSIFGEDVCLVNLPPNDIGGWKNGGLTARSVYQINQMADGLIIGPGNLFENGALLVDLNALRALSVPAMLLSVSFGRVIGRTGKLTLRTDSLSLDAMMALCRFAEPALVRDSATAGHLFQHGFTQTQIVGCPSLFLNRQTLALPARDIGLRDTVLISVRHPDLMSIPPSQRGRLALEIRRIVDQFRASGIPVRLLCHDFKDLDFAQSLPDVMTMYTEDAYRFLAWLRDCRLNITFRLHAFLCCMALGVPSIPLTYDERSKSSMETIGLEDWAIDFLQCNNVAGAIQERFQNILRLDAMRNAVSARWDDLYGILTRGTEQFAAKVEALRKARLF